MDLSLLVCEWEEEPSLKFVVILLTRKSSNKTATFTQISLVEAVGYNSYRLNLSKRKEKKKSGGNED